jgi:Tfp pilus assembly protein PilF
MMLFLLCAPASRAGLYYSGESFADLPSQWRGYVIDHRALRMISVKAIPGRPDNPMRVEYEQAALRLEKAGKERNLSADEQADLGAIYVRLGDLGKAVAVLRNAQAEFPNHFRVTANLGTAWQLQGESELAAAHLRQAVRLAPGKYQKAEEYHLKLVQLRQRQGRDAQKLDALFDARFAGDMGQYAPGKLASAERKKLPSDAVAIVQQLALWLPADGRLLWLLAELANAEGDVKTAAAIMDGCVIEFGMHSPELRLHRRLTRSAAEDLANAAPAIGATARSAHEGHVSLFRPRSKRPLGSRFSHAKLPPINPASVNSLPWDVFAETIIGKQFQPRFAKYLEELDGKQVELAGFMQPVAEDLDMTTFMLIEYPVGCWYCEMPELTSIVRVELAPGKTATFTRNLVKVVGQLTLNAADPENFLYTIRKAKVSEAD